MKAFGGKPYPYMLVAVDALTKKVDAGPSCDHHPNLGAPANVCSDDGSEFKRKFKRADGFLGHRKHQGGHVECKERGRIVSNSQNSFFSILPSLSPKKSPLCHPNLLGGKKAQNGQLPEFLKTLFFSVRQQVRGISLSICAFLAENRVLTRTPLLMKSCQNPFCRACHPLPPFCHP